LVGAPDEAEFAAYAALQRDDGRTPAGAS